MAVGYGPRGRASKPRTTAPWRLRWQYLDGTMHWCSGNITGCKSMYGTSVFFCWSKWQQCVDKLKHLNKNNTSISIEFYHAWGLTEKSPCGIRSLALQLYCEPCAAGGFSPWTGFLEGDCWRSVRGIQVFKALNFHGPLRTSRAAAIAATLGFWLSKPGKFQQTTGKT